jgi:hypothetical protein
VVEADILDHADLRGGAEDPETAAVCEHRLAHGPVLPHISMVPRRSAVMG